MKKLLLIMLFAGALNASANAQNEKNMYSYKKIDNKYVISIQNREEIVKALNAFCEERGSHRELFTGLGRSMN